MVVVAGLAWAGPIVFEDWSDRLDVQVVGASDGLHGVALLDHDRDGDLDVWHSSGTNGASLLLENDGRGGLTDVHEAWQVPVGGAHSGVLAADFDGDGLTDVLELGDGSMTKLVTLPARLLWNRGDRFEVAPTELLVDLLPASTLVATAADIDLDGDLDLFVGAPGRYRRGQPDASVLLRNDRGRFTDITDVAGMADLLSCAAAFVHLDDDAFPDLVSGGCLFGPHTVRHFVNRGDGTFVDVGLDERLWEIGWWMGVATADFDEDGTPDLFLTNIGADAGAPHALYLRNEDDSTWVESATGAGLDTSRYAWGVTAPDFDNDGHADLLFLGNPRNAQIADFGSPGRLFTGDGTGAFAPVELPVDLMERSASGLAQGDLDGDGFPDAVVGVGHDPVTHAPGAPIVLHNAGNDHGWLTVELVQELPNGAAIGALVEASTPDGAIQRRQVMAGSSFGSTESPWPSLGLGGQREASVRVRWPDGTWEAFGTFDAKQRLRLVRGEGGAEAESVVRPGREASGGCSTAPRGLGGAFGRRR